MCGILYDVIQALLGLPASKSRDNALNGAYGLFQKYQCKQTLG
jgi:hypothetical protein